MNQRALQHLDRALQLLSTNNRKIVKSFGNGPDDIIELSDDEPLDIIELSDDEPLDMIELSDDEEPVKLVKKRKERKRDVSLLPDEQVIRPLPKRKERKRDVSLLPDEQVIRPLPKQVRPQYTHIEDEDENEITSPSLSLDKALEMAMKAKEELNKCLPHTAAIGDYKELLEENQELQWNASISRTDTQKQFELTLTQGKSKKKYKFFLNFNDSTATQMHFEIVPDNTRSKELINTKALTVTKRLDSAQLGSAEYFELKIQKKVLLFERYFELELEGGRRIAIQSMR